MPSKYKSTDQLGTYHIAQHPELYTPARSNNYVFYPIFTQRLLKNGVDESIAQESDYINPQQAQEILALSVTSAAVPHSQQNVITIKRGNTEVKFAGSWTYPSGSFVFNDYIGADTKSVLLAWRGLSQHTLDETVGDASDYKVQGILVEYTPDHRQIRYWDMFGCWVSQLSEGDFSSESDDKRQITATIEYDRAIEHLPDDLEAVTFVSQAKETTSTPESE